MVARHHVRPISETVIQYPGLRRKWGETMKRPEVLDLQEPKIQKEDIINFCKEHLASYKKPKSVDFIDAIPKNPYGKVLKRELRETYWIGQARRVR